MQVKSLEGDNRTLVDIISELADTVPDTPDVSRVARLRSTENYILLKEDINKVQVLGLTYS